MTPTQATLDLMSKGGSFVQQLVKLYYQADEVNREIVLDAFGHYFVSYEAMTHQTLARE